MNRFRIVIRALFVVAVAAASAASSLAPAVAQAAAGPQATAASRAAAAPAALVAAQMPAIQAQDGTRFYPGPCSFSETTDLSGLTGGKLVMQCGKLTVPARHADPNGPSLQLSVAVLKSTAANPQPDPVFFLQGGPGGSTIDTYLQLIPLDKRLHGLDRDIVLFDQRGTLYATPNLFCQEAYDETIRELNLDLTKEDANTRYEGALKSCRDRLTSNGADLSWFNSLENAADIESLRLALGYGKINLYGVSYGTQLALHYMRLYPQSLRSAIIDSVIPPQISAVADQPEVLNHGLETIFAACAADAACSRAYPNVKQVFYDQVARLNSTKAHISLTDYKTSTVYPTLLDGDTVLSAVIQMLYATDLLPLIPRTVYQVRAGDYSAIEKILSNVVFSKTLSDGMFYATYCAEEGQFDPAKVNYQGLPGALLDQEKRSTQQFVDTCAVWAVKALPASASDPVQSDVPTLVLAGNFDPVTPPTYAQEAAKTLTHSYLFVMPDGGHGALTSGACQDSLFLQFLADPTRSPDGACVAQQKMVFNTPGALVVLPNLISLINPKGGELALMGVFLAGLLFLLTAVIIYPLVWLVRLARRPAPAPAMEYGSTAEPARLERPFLYRLAPWLAGFTGPMLLAFIIVIYGVTMKLVLSNDNRILFGLPGSARPLFVLPVLAVIFIALMLAGALAAWARRAGSVWGRLYLSLLVLAGAACAVALFAFGLVQALFLG